jgi:hypothetical protein
VKDLLLPFGVLKAFNLVMDKNTGNSKVLLSHLPVRMSRGQPAALLHCNTGLKLPDRGGHRVWAAWLEQMTS